MIAPPRRRRDIVARRTLDAALAALEPSLTAPQRRSVTLDLLRKALVDGDAEIRRRFLERPDGPAAAADRTYLMDQLLRVIHDDALRLYAPPNPSRSERLTLVAVGGYGRGELAPFSDVDLLFLTPYKKTPFTEQVIEHMLYLLWDLGLKVGQATRSLDDCIRMAKTDQTIKTAMLESRYIWGDSPLFQELKKRFAAEVMSGGARDFVEAKLSERDARHARMGDSRYVLEPNIKDGKGGLRDLHTLFWIAKFAYCAETLEEVVTRGVLTAAEARQFAKAERFLWTVRFHLHYIANRAEERMSFDIQAELARRMGYAGRAGASDVERFMKHYFLVAKNIGDLTRIFCAALEAEQKRKPRFNPFARMWGVSKREDQGFFLDGDRFTIRDAAKFLADPGNFIRIFWSAHRSGADIHPTALRLITQHLRRIDAARADPDANRLFIDLLTAPVEGETSLRRLNEAGVLGRFIPDFGRVVAQMQFDMYHVYTVDEHTIFAIGVLGRIERGDLAGELPLASSVAPKIVSRRALYVGLLLHDIAKGRNGDHSELGEEVARRLGPRFGLTEEETETAAWLVRHHLAMSNTAFRRDLNDPQTIDDFCHLVQSPERLKLLYVLTVADIRAVGPNVWNQWKATLLHDLYRRAEEQLAGPLAADDVEAQRKRRVDFALRSLRIQLPDWNDADFDEHVRRGQAPYWLSADTASLARHARMIRRAEQDKDAVALDSKVDLARGVTEVTVYAYDRPGVFARISGALAYGGANILDARIFSLPNGRVLDSFSIQDAQGGAFAKAEKLAKLAVLIERALVENTDLEDLSKLQSAGGAKSKHFKVIPRVLVDNRASATYTVIEVNGRDRPGLLRDVGAALAFCNLQVGSAKISTFGEQAVDVFYVKDIFGLKIERPSTLRWVKDCLYTALKRDG